ncbi:antitoxin [Cellulomonas sp. PhB143]|uniref:antitoxin n=1 Tax=Cellulomonas sp. PhB143 TaxID=2485186 RepID=UPI000F461868|nr:antitoxin [Cellulomonas sp. PhB143]
MSVLERRLQILIDTERYALLENEATRRGASVATVVREAIDAHFASDADARAVAARALLDAAPSDTPAEPDWSRSKQHLADDVDARLA